MRTFIALPIPESLRTAIAGYQADCKALWPKGAVSWSRPESFHLTLRFLGDISEDVAAQVAGALEEAAAASEALDLALVGPMCFPDARRPSVITLECTEPKGLARLVHHVDRLLDAAGLARRDKPFRAHLTLGRVRTRATGDLPLLGEPWPFVSDELVLFRSHLSPQGSRYEPLTIARLGGLES